MLKSSWDMTRVVFVSTPFTLGLIMLGVAGVSLVFCSDLPAAAAADEAGPRIVPDRTEYHFGKVPNDRGVEHVFKIRNEGSKSLVITRVQTSCGCTAAMMETSVIDPEEEGRLRVSFNPRGRKGEVTRTVSVYSNDPMDPVVTLKVVANVVPAGEEKKKPPPVLRTHPKRKKLVFSGDCLRCHAPRKRSETGMKLYVSTCAACHGIRGAGHKIEKEVIGPVLRIHNMTVRTAAGIRQVIAGGTGHPAMPGFGKEYGGPLSDRQVDSLVNLILEEFPAKR